MWFCEGCGDGEGWCGNPSGSRPNFFGRQHLTFDKGGKGVGARRGDSANAKQAERSLKGKGGGVG